MPAVHKQPTSRLGKACKHLAVLAAVAAISAVAALKAAAPYLDAAYAQGYADGKQSKDWKAELAADQELVNKLCHTWWFSMNHSERTLDRKKK